MFSFFSRKKNSPESAEEVDPIPGPDSNSPETNDFIFVDRKGPQPTPATNSIYPSVPGMMYTPQINPAASNLSRTSSNPVSCLEGVPFKLAPQLCQGDSLEVIQLEVDGILAIMTKRLQLDQVDYDFGLEREIAAQ